VSKVTKVTTQALYKKNIEIKEKKKKINEFQTIIGFTKVAFCGNKVTILFGEHNTVNRRSPCKLSLLETFESTLHTKPPY